MANKPLQTAHATQVPFELGEEDHHCFRHGSGVPRCITYCTHHTTLGSSQAVWEVFQFIPMKRLTAEIRDSRLPHQGKVYQHLSETYKNHEYIMECIQAASLRDKLSRSKDGRDSKNLKSVKMQAKVFKPDTHRHLCCSIASN